MNTLRWMRVFGDTIFAAGAIAYVLFIVGLSTGHSYKVAALSTRLATVISQASRRRWPAQTNSRQIDRTIVSSILNRLGAATACG
jgi:hypothetical protein